MRSYRENIREARLSVSRKRINKDVITVGQGSSGKAAAAGNFNIGHHRHRRTHDSRFKTLETGAAGRDQYSSITNGGDAGIKSRAACPISRTSPR